jgi:UDP-N-acetylglucosamine:LPS N-acetylglucosamine transferase
VEDLRTARAVIASGGFSLMGEAVHLRVPMLAVPLEAQFEQEMNARWLEHLGYGERAATLDADRVAAFLARTDEHAHALQSYTPRDNSMLYACVDECLARAAAGEPRAKTLAAAGD